MIRSIFTALILAFAAVFSTSVSAGEKPARLDGSRSKFELTVNDVTDGVNVRHVGLLAGSLHLAIALCCHTNCVESKGASASLASNRIKDSVVRVGA